MVIYDTMVVIHSIPSEPTWEDLCKIFIKLYQLEESTETILVFDKNTDELEYSLKEKERSDMDGSTAPWQNKSKNAQGKIYPEFL